MTTDKVESLPIYNWRKTKFQFMFSCNFQIKTMHDVIGGKICLIMVELEPGMSVLFGSGIHNIPCTILKEKYMPHTRISPSKTESNWIGHCFDSGVFINDVTHF